MKFFKFNKYTVKQKQMVLTSALLVALGFNISFTGNNSYKELESKNLAARYPQTSTISLLDSKDSFAAKSGKDFSYEIVSFAKDDAENTQDEKNKKKDTDKETEKKKHSGEAEGRVGKIETKNGDVKFTLIKQGDKYVAITEAGSCTYCNELVTISDQAEDLGKAVVDAIKAKQKIDNQDKKEKEEEIVAKDDSDDLDEKLTIADTKLEKVAKDCEKKYEDREGKKLYSIEDTEVFCNTKGFISLLSKSKESPSEIHSIRFLTETIAPELIESILNPSRLGEKESAYKALQALESKIPKKQKELREIVSKIAAEVVRKQAISIKQKLRDSELLKNTNLAASTALLEEAKYEISALPYLNRELYQTQVLGLNQALNNNLVDTRYANGIMNNYSLYTQDIVNGMTGNVNNYLIPLSALNGIPGAENLFMSDTIFGNNLSNASSSWLIQPQQQMLGTQFQQQQPGTRIYQQPGFNAPTFSGRGSLSGGTITQGQTFPGQYQMQQMQQYAPQMAPYNQAPQYQMQPQQYVTPQQYQSVQQNGRGIIRQ